MTGTLQVVVPCYNEASRLDDQAFVSFVAAHSAVHVCFVDDGSTDATPTRLAAIAAAAAGRISVMRLERNAGKAEAVRQGLLRAAAAGHPIAAYLDADLAAPLDAAILLGGALDDHPELVLAIGSRVKLLGWRISRSERRHYLGRAFATFASLALGLPVYDTQCGAKALRLTGPVVAALQTPFLSRWLFDVELIARLRDAVGADGMREVPLPVWQDPGGSSLRAMDFLKAPVELLSIRLRYPHTSPSIGGDGVDDTGDASLGER